MSASHLQRCAGKAERVGKLLKIQTQTTCTRMCLRLHRQRKLDPLPSAWIISKMVPWRTEVNERLSVFWLHASTYNLNAHKDPLRNRNADRRAALEHDMLASQK